MDAGLGRRIRRAAPRRARSEIPTADVPRRLRFVRVLGIGIRLSHHLRTSDPGVDESPSLDATGDAPAATTGERLDFETFYRHQYPSVVRLAYSLCGSMSVAEELAQEGFMTAHRRWQRVEGFDRPDLWVRRVVINRSISYRRREASERKAFQRIRDRWREHVEQVVADEEVWAALRELSPRQAEVLALFYVEDQPLSAVAEILGLGEETVKTHLKRGRAAMAARLGETEEPA
jgi:RNA polymerase sigma-70 factor (ECF subfamily)